jgi:hypothetical protein
MTNAVPRTVVWATRLLWLLWATSAAYMGHKLYLAYRLTLPGAVPLRLPSRDVTRIAIQTLVLFAISAFLIYAVARGRGWARMTCSVLALLAALFVIMGLGTLLTGSQPAPIEQLLLLGALLLAYGAIPFLLFHPQSTPWFKKRTEVQPNKSLERTRGG